MTPQDKENTAQKTIIDMLTVANEFCIFTETAGKFNLLETCEYYHRVLPLLYLKGSLLPDTEPEEEGAAEKYINEEQWEEVFNRFRNLFGNQDEYFIAGQNDTGEDSILNASLSENIADIYQDMKDFILLYSKNTYHSKQNAVYLCRVLYKSRWGVLIPNALNHLHSIIYGAEKDNFETYPY